MISNKGFRKKSISSDRRVADLPEDFGNRQGFLESRIPSDDLGNVIENDPIATFVHDSLGNTTDGEPAHLRSGFLNNMGIGETHRRYRSDKEIRPRDVRVIKPEPVSVPMPVPVPKNADEYIASLKQEFAKLLKNKAGMPFSFSMRPLAANVDEELIKDYLSSIESFIEQMFESSSIDAELDIALYRTDAHRFAIFFINSKEKDPVKNKELISALRQVVSLFEKKHGTVDTNVMLVLSNAKSIIEDHLHKIGAKKVS